MARKKISKKNFKEVMSSIIEMFESSSKEEQSIWVSCMNNLLDDMRDEDFFGTEGQTDPRGDNRN